MSESTAARVAAVLLAFEDATRTGGTRTVSDVSRAVGRERSQVSRMLKELARSGLVEQDEHTRAYRLGWNLRILAQGAGDSPLVEASRPALQALVAKTGEVALLSVQEGNRSLTVLREETTHSLRAGGWVGRRSPMYCTASGRALLFGADQDTIEALTATDLEAPTAPGGPRDLRALMVRLEVERTQGYAVASEEVEIGLTSVAAPIQGQLGTSVGVLNVSAPTSRIISRCDSIGQLLIAASRAVSQNLRARPPRR